LALGTGRTASLRTASTEWNQNQLHLGWGLVSESTSTELSQHQLDSHLRQLTLLIYWQLALPTLRSLR